MPSTSTRVPAASRVALVAWAALLGVGVVVGGHLAAHHPEYHVDAAPFIGHWSVAAARPTIVLVVFAAFAVAALPRWLDRISWRAVVSSTFAVALLWSLLLSASEGLRAVPRPLHSPADYLAGVPLIRTPGRFLSTFTAEWMRFPTHVKGHPPGLVLTLWLFARVGLGGPGWATALELLVGAAAAPAVVVAVRDVWSERAARAAAPFVALAPAAVWATSGDALFAGVTAWAIALLVLATARTGRASRMLASAGGAAWGAAVLLTYGVVLLAVVPMAIAWWRRRLDVVAVAAGVVLLAVGAVAVAGFWWPAGLATTHRAYLAGVAPHRAYRVFVWLDLAAFAAVIGPAVVPALVALRDRGAWLLAGSALAALAAADLSGLAKGEVERIWLPWAPWLLIATAALPASLVARRRWLGGQVAFAVGLQILLRSSW